MQKKLMVLAAGVVGALLMVSAAEAQSSSERTVQRSAEMTTTAARLKSKRSYRKSTRVYGYVARRGGYSYSYADVTNTYGLSRSLFGSMNTWRDPSLDRQTNSGPFDHDFFFDSGMGPRGGNAPMLH